MNAVEIEAAVSELADQPFDPAEFPFQFLAAFDKKETQLKRLRKGDTNRSDVAGAYLLQSSIHIAVCEPGQTGPMLNRLRQSPKTVAARAKFIFATDGRFFEAEDLAATSPIADELFKLADHFGYFLPLAGISTVREIKDNPIDIRATGRLNKLYVELLKLNPEWATDARRHDMNHFMARLIFCFFAEDTGIFLSASLFTDTVEQMSESDGGNTRFVLEQMFRCMNTAPDKREAIKLPTWAGVFPYVNGGLFSGSTDVPNFSRIARSYLLQAGKLDWQQINPDIFGSMIQAVADDEERGALGMHYTSVPNILKVLNPLFLDDLRTQLETAGENKRMLRNLRTRMSRIRVFDPACGSGNFLVIAYKQMRAIEAVIDKRLNEIPSRSALSLKNFRGIEIRDFAVEIARLALVIAEYQSNVAFLGKVQANLVFLPLSDDNWITRGNALRLDWLEVCPPEGTGVKLRANDLFQTPLEQAEVDFENEGGETYICGNPPYLGRNKKGDLEREDTSNVFRDHQGSFASLDYVANWFYKAAQYMTKTNAAAGIVATKSICQGEQVALLWPILFTSGATIAFARTPFEWANLASANAGVTVVILGLRKSTSGYKQLYSGDEVRSVDVLGPYLVAGTDTIVKRRDSPLSLLANMYLGNMAKDGGNLIFSRDEGRRLLLGGNVNESLIRSFYGSEELISGTPRACLWVEESSRAVNLANTALLPIFTRVAEFRAASSAPSTRAMAHKPYRFIQLSAKGGKRAIVIPRVSSERRAYLPVDYLSSGPIIGDKCYAIFDEPLWNLALVASKLHIVWISTVCSRLRTDFSYGNTLGWNTFPVPKLTEQSKADLTRCAENILLAREAHFPASIADLYDPEHMPPNLRAAHEDNDETLERIYIGRRFKNDTERLEVLFAMYTKMTAAEAAGPKSKARVGAKKKQTSRVGQDDALLSGDRKNEVQA